MFKLKDFISSENIFFNLQGGEEKETVLKEMIHKICEVNGTVSLEDELLEKIISREKIETTGIGRGIAIPHCYYKDFTNVKIYAGFPEYPVKFDSLDGQSVRAIFMIISGEKERDIYVKALSRLMYLTRNLEIREKLISLNEKDELLKLIQNCDNEMDYISYVGLKHIISLLRLEEEIETYIREMKIEIGNDSLNLNEDNRYIILQEKYQSLLKNIDNRLLSIYKQLKQKYGGEIIAMVQKNICSNCNVQVPFHLIREINRKNQIVQCTTCSKILVRPERPKR